MVIQEAERRADGEGVQPQAQLRQLHRQRVEVHAVDAALHHQAGQQRGVVQPGRIDRDALTRHLRQDLPPHALDQPLHGVPVPRHVGMGVVIDLHPPDDAIGQVIHRVDQEMAAAHRAVAHFDPQERFERIAFGVRQFGLEALIGRLSSAWRSFLCRSAMRSIAAVKRAERSSRIGSRVWLTLYSTMKSGV